MGVHQRKPTLRCRTMLVRDLRQPPPIAQYVPPKRRRRKLPLEMVLEGVCGEMSHGTVSHCRRAAAQTLTGHRHHWTLDPAAVERRRFATDNHQNGPRGNTKADAIGEHAVEVASLPHQKQKTPHTQQSKVPTTASKTVPIPHAVPIAPHASTELPELPGRQTKRIAGSSIMVPRAGSSLDTDGCLPPILLDQNR